MAVVIATGSSLIFTILVLCSSFVTTTFLSAYEDSHRTYIYSSYGYGLFTSPWEVASDLIRAFLRIIKDERGIIDDTFLSSSRPIKYDARAATEIPVAPPGILRRFVTRFLLGLPVVGAASIVHLLLSMPLLGPVHWIARYRGNRRRGDSKDIAALIVLALLAVGAVRYPCHLTRPSACLIVRYPSRALYKVYRLTEKWTKRLLLRAEDAILEVQ